MGRSPHKRPLDRDTTADRISAMPHWDESAQAPSGAAITRRCPAGKQRVLVVRALAQQTRLLLLDEPSNHLDVRCQLEILALVRELGLTTVAALHDLNLVARFCNRLYLMAAGRVVASGTPAEVLIPERIAEVFGVRADRWCDPQTGQLHLAFDCLAPRAVRAGSSRIWAAMSTHVDDCEYPLQMAEVRPVASGQGEPVPYGGGGDQQIPPARPRVSPSLANDVGEKAVELGHLGVER